MQSLGPGAAALPEAPAPAAPRDALASCTPAGPAPRTDRRVRGVRVPSPAQVNSSAPAPSACLCPLCAVLRGRSASISFPRAGSPSSSSPPVPGSPSLPTRGTPAVRAVGSQVGAHCRAPKAEPRAGRTRRRVQLWLARWRLRRGRWRGLARAGRPARAPLTDPSASPAPARSQRGAARAAEQGPVTQAINSDYGQLRNRTKERAWPWTARHTGEPGRGEPLVSLILSSRFHSSSFFFLTSRI